jgi:hypothetical protein
LPVKSPVDMFPRTNFGPLGRVDNLDVLPKIQ